MSRGPRAVPLELSEAERIELRRLLRRRGVGQALAQRVRVVLACAEPGATHWSTRTMARRAGMSQTAVSPIRINGALHYPWRAVNQRGLVLDILVQDRRNGTAAKRFFRRLLAGLKYKPRRVVTDGLRSYGVEQREVLPGVRHRTSRYLKNRAENSHRPTRRRERQTQRFKSPVQARRFLSSHSVIHGHFRRRRRRFAHAERVAARQRTPRKERAVFSQRVAAPPLLQPPPKPLAARPALQGRKKRRSLMPTYACSTAAGRLSSDQRLRIAKAITETHHEVAVAPRYFVQVIFYDLAPGSHYVAGEPAAPGHIWIRADIRSGRTQEQKSRLLTRIAEEVSAIADVTLEEVWVYISDIPGQSVAEFGHILPNPGEEDAWFAKLPNPLQARLRELA